MEHIYEKYDDRIVRAQDMIIYPTSMLNLNNANKTTTFNIDGIDTFLNIKKARFVLTGKLVKSDGSNYDANATVKLNTNFPSFLFSRIELRKHGKILDVVENCGRTSHILGLVSNDYAKENAGFHHHFKSPGNFQVVGSLADFGLGFFKDIRHPVFKGGFTLIFTRNDDNECIYRWKGEGTTATLPGEGKVAITEFTIRIPELVYEDIAKIRLPKELEELSSKNNYHFVFKSYQSFMVGDVNGKTLKTDLTTNYRNVNNPIFAFVAFQSKDRSDSQIKRPTFFDHANVQNIHFNINGRRYPEENTNFDFGNNNLALAYDMYMDYKRVFNNGDVSKMILSPESFKDYPIYCFDLTRQPVNISAKQYNIILHATFSADVTNTNCYIVIVSLADFTYDLLNNNIIENV